MKKGIFTILFLISSISSVLAQNLGYDEKTPLQNGLFKVKSGNYYGIIDNKENVIVSIEYQDILFHKGKALLTKNNILMGMIDSVGFVRDFSGEYIIHPKFKYVYDGFIIVSEAGKKTTGTEWGFIREDGVPLKLGEKTGKLANVFVSSKTPSFYKEVTPFIEGIAAVYDKKDGWRHFDYNGNERFILGNDKSKINAIFRSSIYKGECIIVTSTGIKHYQENNSSQAIVKRILASTANFVSDNTNLTPSQIVFKEGVITLDSLVRTVKFETRTDSIIFIKPPVKIEPKKDTIKTVKKSFIKDLHLELTSKKLQADNKAYAHTEVKITNKGVDKIEDFVVNISCNGTKREWKGDLEPNSNIRLSFSMPARFSSPTENRTIVVQVTHNDENLEKKFPVTVNRYNPIRSR